MIKTTSRDNGRTPMQWNDSKNAGFTNSKPWLGINKNYSRINMESQKNDSESILNFYKTMIKLRESNELLKSGSFRKIKIRDHLFIYARELNGRSLIVALNFSKRTQKISYNCDIILSSYGRLHLDGILKPYEAIIICRE
jgi:glycosidase